MERGTGVEDYEIGTEGEADKNTKGGLHSQTPRVVVARRARSAVAPHARSVPRARLRVHAAADAGESSRGVLSEISGALPESRVAGPSSTTSGARGLGGTGILCAGAESA